MKVISVAGDRPALLLTGRDTGGRYTLMEAILAPGHGPPPHVHEREDEGFLVMEGELTSVTRESLERMVTLAPQYGIKILV